MKKIFKAAIGIAALTVAGLASADITFYEHDNFFGRQFTVHDPVDNFARIGFNDRASSIVVTGTPWEVCDDAGFRGTCVVLRPGNYPSLSAMNLNDRVSSAREARRDRPYPPAQYAPPPLPGQITFYHHDNFQGRSFNTQSDVPDFRQFGFNDRASSAVVAGDRWEACDNAGFSGHCIVLRPGNYPSLAAMGMNDNISSVRRVPPGMPVADGQWAPPPPVPAYDPRPLPQEQLFQANVVSSRAVYGTPQQHCWVEQEAVPGNRQNGQVGGAVIGGILGGILGHQVARGNGATIIGAVGGAAVGSAIGGNAAANQVENVQHCAPTQVSGPPLYWDTTYMFRGTEHHVQTTAPAGPTLTVNGYGEPRMQ